MVEAGEADVRVLHTPDKWYGMTYAEDRAMVTDAIRAMTAAGHLPGKALEMSQTGAAAPERTDEPIDRQDNMALGNRAPFRPGGRTGGRQALRLRPHQRYLLRFLRSGKTRPAAAIFSSG